jgi:hypothetical protein
MTGDPIPAFDPALVRERAVVRAPDAITFEDRRLPPGHHDHRLFPDQFNRKER